MVLVVHNQYHLFARVVCCEIMLIQLHATAIKLMRNVTYDE